MVELASLSQAQEWEVQKQQAQEWIPEYVKSTSNSITWTEWNGTYYKLGYDAGNTLSQYVWTSWNQEATGTASSLGQYTLNQTEATNQYIWTKWNYQRQCYSDVQSGNVIANAAQNQRNLEHEAQLQRELRAMEEQNKQLKAEIKAANDRAAILLLKSLDPAQREEFQRDKAFTVISADGQRRYRITKGRARNIHQIGPDGSRIVTLCAHPADSVPDFDTMLAQKLMLEHSEEEFLRIANRS